MKIEANQATSEPSNSESFLMKPRIRTCSKSSLTPKDLKKMKNLSDSHMFPGEKKVPDVKSKKVSLDEKKNETPQPMDGLEGNHPPLCSLIQNPSPLSAMKAAGRSQLSE